MGGNKKIRGHRKFRLAVEFRTERKKHMHVPWAAQGEVGPVTGGYQPPSCYVVVSAYLLLMKHVTKFSMKSQFSESLALLRPSDRVSLILVADNALPCAATPGDPCWKRMESSPRSPTTERPRERLALVVEATRGSSGRWWRRRRASDIVVDGRS